MANYSGPYRHISVHLRESDKGLLISCIFFKIHRGKRSNVHLGHWVTVPSDALTVPTPELERRILAALTTELGT
jgi:hypothetical protein